MIEYFENDLTVSDVERLNKLLEQLSPTLPSVSWERVEQVMAGGYIFTARDAEKKASGPRGDLVGMATLIPLAKLASSFGNVEDVVVFESYRGQGIGRGLMEAIIKKAKELEMQHLFLTSNPKREAARTLYKKLGFDEYDTTPFKLYFNR